jgi:hypothetical protein
MVQFKALILVIVAIISLNNNRVNAILFDDEKKTDCGYFIFYNSTDTIRVIGNEFEVKTNKTGFDLKIIEANKLSLISMLENPFIEICLLDKRFLAKGIDIFSSHIPEESDYFFPLDKNKHVVLFNKNTLQFKKIE